MIKKRKFYIYLHFLKVNFASQGSTWAWGVPNRTCITSAICVYPIQNASDTKWQELFGKPAVPTHCTWPNINEYIHAYYHVNRVNKRHGLAGRYALYIYICNSRLLPNIHYTPFITGSVWFVQLKTTYGPDVSDWCRSWLITDVFHIPGEQLQLFSLIYN